MTYKVKTEVEVSIYPYHINGLNDREALLTVYQQLSAYMYTVLERLFTMQDRGCPDMLYTSARDS